MNGKYFAFKINFINNYKIHTDEKPFDFIQCDKGISLKVTLVDHPRIHIGEEPFKCD